MTAVCRSCGAPIVWETTVTAKAMPIDPDPDPAGNVDVVWIGGERVALVLGPADAVAAQAAGHKLYVSHFGTCPSAGAWRRRDRPSLATVEGSLTTGERRSE